MGEKDMMKAFEESAFKEYLSDGLVEIAIGIGVLMAGLVIFLDQPAFAGLSGMIAVFIPIMKKAITHPRIGQADFRSQAGRKTLKLSLIVGTTVLLLMLLSTIFITDALSESVREFLHRYIPAIIGIIVIGFALGIALTTKVWRILVYIALLVTVVAIMYFTSMELGYVFFAFGGIFLTVGIILLVQFLDKHPVIEVGDYDSES